MFMACDAWFVAYGAVLLACKTVHTVQGTFCARGDGLRALVVALDAGREGQELY